MFTPPTSRLVLIAWYFLKMIKCRENVLWFLFYSFKVFFGEYFLVSYNFSIPSSRFLQLAQFAEIKRKNSLNLLKASSPMSINIFENEKIHQRARMIASVILSLLWLAEVTKIFRTWAACRCRWFRHLWRQRLSTLSFPWQLRWAPSTPCAPHFLIHLSWFIREILLRGKKFFWLMVRDKFSCKISHQQLKRGNPLEYLVVVRTKSPTSTASR